jgi:putative ABC transport system permease protein
MEAELDEELHAHLERQVEKYVRSGLPSEDAARRARLEFGGLDRVKEKCRDARGVTFIETLLQDARYGLRVLAKNPGFTAVAVLTLALGIGANTAIFSVVNAVLLRALPYREPGRLVMVFWSNPAWGQDRIPLCVADFDDWKASNHAFDRPTAFGTNLYDYTSSQEPQRIVGSVISPGFFSALGVEPALGRNFLPEEEKPGGRLAVIVSHDFWIHSLGGNADAIGRNITLNGQSYTVVGVMRGSFRFPAETIKLWEPLRLEPPTRRGPYFLRGLARLRPGISLQRARADMAAVNQRIREETHATDTGSGFNVLPFETYLVGNVRPVLLVLMAAVGFVLLIAVANLANLMLVKAIGRQREIALRAALGAGRVRVIRQLLTEGAVLTALGAGLGLLLAYGSVNLLVAMSPADVPRLDEVGIDGWVLGFTLLLSILSSLFFALAPALRVFRFNLNDALKEGGGRGASLGHGRFRGALVVAEVGLALILLIGATLMVTSFARLQRVDAGFDPRNLLTAEISMPDFRYSDPQRVRGFYHQLLERIETLPGVRSAAVASGLPPDLMQLQDTFTIEGRPTPPNETDPLADFLFVSGDYFRTIGVPVLQGRTFSDADRQAAPLAVIVNQALARRFFHNQNPVGRRLRQNRDNPWMAIVGVVGDVKYSGLGAQAFPALYVSYVQHGWPGAYLVVRATRDPLALAPGVRQAVWSLDKELPVEEMKTAEQRMRESVAEPRFRTLLIGAFAFLALSLAAVGIYGVISYSAAQRTHEVGIRVALGAARLDIVRLVVGQALLLSLAGTAVGLVGALALTRYLAGMLYSVRATDPLIFAGVSIFLVGLSLVASLIPARRATKVDPTVALRWE